jgi:hypothetical protein
LSSFGSNVGEFIWKFGALFTPNHLDECSLHSGRDAPLCGFLDESRAYRAGRLVIF